MCMYMYVCQADTEVVQKSCVSPVGIGSEVGSEVERPLVEVVV